MSKVLFIIFSLVFFFSSCSVSHRNETIKEAERLLDTAPDSTLYILELVLSDYAHLSDTEKAHFGILYYAAIDKTHRIFPPLDIIDHSINFYRRKNANIPLAKAFFYKSRATQSSYSYQETLELLLNAYKYLNRNCYNLLGKIYYDKAVIASSLKETKESIAYYRRAAHYFKLSGENRSLALALLAMSVVYNQLEKDEDKLKELSLQAL